MYISDCLEKIRQKKPLIHHITNWVTIYDCANITRAIGALPVMAHAKEEVEQMASIADALVLNIGTLTTDLIESMILASVSANKKGIPVILDAVGAGATDFRTQKTKEILKQVKISVLKGNSSEIGTIAGVEAETRGVEAISVKGNLTGIAKHLAIMEDITVVITGKEDIISNGTETYICKNGHNMLGKFVGTGCMSASLIGVFCAVEKDYAFASAAALSCFGIAGELAAENAKGPGTYKISFFDEIFNLNSTSIDKLKKIEKII
ncbi:MAG: hydroxyethylthiazole kinase [Actinobacteria bacterium]|nr:hydroxyethylthiazole kinase [Actinomycetota bacterium]